MLLEKTDVDFIAGQCLETGEKTTCQIPPTDTTHCLMVTSKSVCRPTTMPETGSGPLPLDLRLD